MEVDALNELMAALGFIIPSAVLWQVWKIGASFSKMQLQIEGMLVDLAKLKRANEDAALIKKVLDNGNI